MNLNKTISDRMRAGALVLLVQEPDEALAVACARAGASGFQPIKVVSAADGEVMEALIGQKTGQGTLILTDFLRVYGGNPTAARLIREVALQERATGSYSRLILVESPGVEVPKGLSGDIEFITSPLPLVEELLVELKQFIKDQSIKLEGNGENEYSLASAVAGLSRHEAARLFARCIIESGKKMLDAAWLRAQKAARLSERLAGALTFIDSDSADVGGLDLLKKWLNTRKGAFDSKAARQEGLPEPKGLLLVGIPGAGKSLTAKTVAREWGLPLLRFDVGKAFGSLVGQSEANIRAAIEAAEACAPCVLWIDEIEKGLAGTKGGGGDSGTTMRVFGTMLTWLQEKTKPVFVVATANRVADLPPELLRKGRFDEIFFVDLPSEAERLDIVSIHLARRDRSLSESECRMIARASDGFSGAEIEQAIIEGMFNAFVEGRKLKAGDVVDSIAGTVPLSKTMAEDIKALRTWANGRAKLASSNMKKVAESESVAPMRRPTIR